MLNTQAGRDLRPQIRSADAVPYFVSDLSVVRALQAHNARKPLSAEKLRAAKLVTLVASVRAGETLVERRADPWAVEFVLEVQLIAASLALQVRQVEEAIRYLREAGVLSQVQTAGAVRFRLSDSVYERSDAADALDWPGILARLEGEPAALLVARAFADLLPPPFTSWSTVRLTALGEHTGYGTITARKGKDVLVQLGVVEEDSQAGHTSRFRFSDLARGIGSAPSVASTAPTFATAFLDQPSARAEVATTARPAPTVQAGTVSLRIGGLELCIPQGTSVRIEITGEGRQMVHVGEHVVIGPL
jgi:hypothetical protein